MKKAMLALALAAVAVPAAPVLVAPAEARSHHYDRRYYNSRGEYRSARRISRNDYVWRGNDGRYHCRRSNGTTGLIIGGAAGAVLGNVVDGGHDRTLGTLLGAAGGALVGRSIDRSNLKCR